MLYLLIYTYIFFKSIKLHQKEKINLKMYHTFKNFLQIQNQMFQLILILISIDNTSGIMLQKILLKAVNYFVNYTVYIINGIS